MSCDPWIAEGDRERGWSVLDENRLTVAHCGDRQDDAETIVREHNAPVSQLIEVLERITACDLSTVRADYNGPLLRAIADAHDLLARLDQ